MNIPLDKFESYLKNKNLKERTIENYAYYFNKFIVFDSFTQESVSKFLSLKQNRNSCARSFLVNLQKFLKINYKELNISEDLRNNIIEVELPKLTGRTKTRIIKPVSYNDILLLEKCLETEQLKLQLLLSYYCALRLGEMLKITILSFNWDEWKKDMSKMGECRVYGKGDKEGIALVPPELMKRIAKYVRKRGFKSPNNKLFIRETKKINMKNRARIWQMRLREAGIRAKLTKLDEKGKPIQETVIHPHRLRHSYAHYLLNVKGIDIRHVQEVLRHNSIQSTEIYTYIDKEDLKEKLTKKKVF